MSEPPSQVQEFLELFALQKQQLQENRQEKRREWDKLQQQRRRERLWLQGGKVKHDKPWNNSNNASWLQKREFKALEPDPNGKPFDLDGRSIWPVVKDRSGKKKKVKPWYAVKNGRLFGDPPAPRNRSNDDRMKSRSSPELPTTQSEHGSNNNNPKMLSGGQPKIDTPWRIPCAAKGKLFTTYLPDPSISTFAREKLEILSMQKQRAKRDPWLPTKS